MLKYHLDDYIHFIQRIGGHGLVKEFTKKDTYFKDLARYNFGEDCPAFDGLWEFCQISTGGSITGAKRLCDGSSEIAINYAGGLHHAKKAECAGFCYTNDIVLAILELLKRFHRVLYVDVDIHHGDGVEEAFYLTDRVMTVSFHKYGDYFPGTGDPSDIGLHKGKGFSVNFPLKDGITDDRYVSIFKPVMTKVMETFQPDAIVMQCGADSLGGDVLGTFNLTLKGHAECVAFMQKFNIPLLVLGGGGYTVKNVARCWAYETAVLCGKDIKEDEAIPRDGFTGNIFLEGEKVHFAARDAQDMNAREELEKQIEQIYENLRHVQGPPSVGLHQVPYNNSDNEDADKEDGPATGVKQEPT